MIHIICFIHSYMPTTTQFGVCHIHHNQGFFMFFAPWWFNTLKYVRLDKGEWMKQIKCIKLMILSQCIIMMQGKNLEIVNAMYRKHKYNLPSNRKLLRIFVNNLFWYWKTFKVINTDNIQIKNSTSEIKLQSWTQQMKMTILALPPKSMYYCMFHSMDQKIHVSKVMKPIV